MAKTGSFNREAKIEESFSDCGLTKAVEMVLSTASTNRSVPIPSNASGIEIYSSADCAFSLSSGLAAKSTVTDTDATSNDLAERNFVIANTLVARQFPATGTDRTLYVRSETAGCTVKINFLG